MNIKVKLTNVNAKLPERSNPTDAGADLFSTKNELITPHGASYFDFGVQMEIPVGYTGLVFARSGLGSRGIRPKNCVGVIDSKYRGNIKANIENDSEFYERIEIGDRIAQIVIVPIECCTFEQVDELDMTDNRGGGFGHSGK